MFCSNCGINLPDDANFCMKCGKPQKPDLQEQAEMCEIRLNYEDKGRWKGIIFRFEAVVVGKNRRVVATSETIPSQGQRFDRQEIAATYNYSNLLINQVAQEVLDKLIDVLAADGWKVLAAQGKYWYSYKLSRK